jgi:hypothetical protein
MLFYVKLRSMTLARRMAGMGHPEQKKTLGRSRHRRENNIKTVLNK